MLEKIGEAIISFIEKLGEFILNLPENLRMYGKKLRRISAQVKQVEVKPSIPNIFKKFYERRGLTVREYVIQKTYIAIIIFLLTSVIYVVKLSSAKIFPLIMIISGCYIFYLIKFEMNVFEKDALAYKIIFSSFLLIIGFIILANKFLMPKILKYFPISNIFLRFFPLVIFALVLIFFVGYGFKKKFGRDFTFGEVIEVSGKLAKVRIGYDLRAGTTPGTHFIENPIGAKTGEKVKVRIKKGFFSIRGAKPIHIIQTLKQ